MTITTKGSAKALLAALGVAAAIGVYGELSSLPEADESVREPSSAAVARVAEPARRPAAPSLGERGRARSRSARSPDVASASRAPRAPSTETVARAAAAAAEEAAPPDDDPVARAATALAARLAAEPLDTTWASVAEGLIADHFASSEGGASSVAARCRSSVCRIELAFENEAMRDEGLGSLTLPWDTTGVFHLDERDPLRLVIYATREPEDQAPRG